MRPARVRTVWLSKGSGFTSNLVARLAISHTLLLTLKTNLSKKSKRPRRKLDRECLMTRKLVCNFIDRVPPRTPLLV